MCGHLIYFTHPHVSVEASRIHRERYCKSFVSCPATNTGISFVPRFHLQNPLIAFRGQPSTLHTTSRSTSSPAISNSESTGDLRTLYNAGSTAQCRTEALSANYHQHVYFACSRPPLPHAPSHVVCITTSLNIFVANHILVSARHCERFTNFW